MSGVFKNILRHHGSKVLAGLLEPKMVGSVILKNMQMNSTRQFSATGSLIPIVIEQTGRGERAYDIYSR